MDIKILFASCGIVIATLLSLLEVTEAIDPYYIPRAKIISRKELDKPEHPDGFAPTARKCKKLGERAAKKSLSCVPDVHFYESMMNRVHFSKAVLNRSIGELKSLASRISRCSHKYAKYYERGCTMKATYLNDRRRCRMMLTRRERTVCKGEIKRRYFR